MIMEKQSGSWNVQRKKKYQNKNAIKFTGYAKTCLDLTQCVLFLYQYYFLNIDLYGKDLPGAQNKNAPFDKSYAMKGSSTTQCS